VFHLNYSALGPAIRADYPASRVFAAERSRRWPVGRRLFYACGSLLLPLMRLPRILRQAREARLKWRIAAPALGPAFVILCAGAAGEMLGYSLGPSDAKRRLMDFEREHARLYTARDIEAVASSHAVSHSRA